MAVNNQKDNILRGAAEDLDFANGANSLSEFFYTQLTLQKNFVSLVDGISDEHLTSDALVASAIRVAAALSAAGITDGDKVATCSENRLEIAAAMFGTLLLGATLVPTNPSYSERELHHAVHLARPKVMFASAQSFAAIDKVSRQSAFVELVICLDTIPQVGGNRKLRTYEQFVASAKTKGGQQFRSRKQDMANKVALILYSSGTTGLPKGVELTEKNILVSISQHVKHESDDVKRLCPEPILLTVGPWSHAFGCMAMIGLVASRTKIIFLPKFVDTDYLGAIQKYRVNTAHVVPPLMVFLAKHPIVANYDLSSLKMIGCGAAPLSKELEEAVRARIGVPLVRQGYGMTETTLAVTEQTAEHCKIGSVGRLRAGTAGRVVDIETGAVLAANQRGELQFAGATIMRGYIGDEAATRETIDADGWLHTGDIGYYDVDGEWFIVDRLKELIKYNGFQVPPAELEGILLQHPLISDAGVVGVPDERAGELPLAFVVRQANGAALTEREVQDFVAARTSKAKRLHGGVRFVAAIPKNPSGKILRRELRELLKTVPSKL